MTYELRLFAVNARLITPAMTCEPDHPRRDAARTRARILDAAKAVFARTSYADAGIREIATLAQVDSALVSRYFGSKAGLLEAALIDNLRAHPDRTIMSMDRADFGRRLAEQMIRDDVEVSLPTLAMTVSDTEGRRIAERVTREHVLPPLMEWLGPPDARSRAFRLFITVTGFAMHVRHMRGADDPRIDADTVEWFAHTVQDIIDAAPSPAGAAPQPPAAARA